jgi:hypothetical protein
MSAGGKPQGSWISRPSVGAGRAAWRSAFLAVPSVLLLSAVGCGSRPARTPPTPEFGPRPLYHVAKTQACLLRKGVHVGGSLDFIASSAPAGAFAARLFGNEVEVSFGATSAEGRRLEAGYRRFAGGNAQADLALDLRRYDNVVVFWHSHPDDRSLALLAGCLD